MAEAVPWGTFSADPRRTESASLRASDRDRDLVHGVLAEAYADGRLDRAEYDERSAATAAAKTLGELPPMLADLVPMTPTRPGSELARATPDEIEAQAVRRWEHQRREAVNGLIFISVITWAIWALTSAPGFPWPIFPMLFVAMRVPQVLMNKQEIVAREREKLLKKQRKALEGGPES
ncbi:MAG: DUF1707 domain-containing protein [Nocardioidaceae bacterium]|nr:DUF1707 domain-containing protein [Nocardioidaceae bacterium]